KPVLRVHEPEREIGIGDRAREKVRDSVLLAQHLDRLPQAPQPELSFGLRQRLAKVEVSARQKSTNEQEQQRRSSQGETHFSEHTPQNAAPRQICYKGRRCSTASTKRSTPRCSRCAMRPNSGAAGSAIPLARSPTRRSRGAW